VAGISASGLVGIRVQVQLRGAACVGSVSRVDRLPAGRLAGSIGRDAQNPICVSQKSLIQTEKA